MRKRDRDRFIVSLAAGAWGVAWFAWHGGARALSPTRLDWLLTSDWGQHVLGWLFFRNEPWHLPLGAIRGAAYPLGTSVGYTDSNPLLAIGLKPFASVLPTEFQYIGPWLGLCFALQGFLGAGLVARVASGRVVAFLGGLMFAMAPTLMFRIVHDTLCAHFLILAAIGLHLAPIDPVRSRYAMLGIVALAAGIHPYLAVMMLALGVALFWHHHAQGTLSRREWLGFCGGASILVLVIFAVVGYFGGGVDPGAGGLGDFSASPLTLFDSMGRSRWVPALPSGKVQYEGFAYLGLGGLFLSAVAVVARVKSWGSARDLSVLPRPLQWACVGLAIFALVPWFPPGVESILSPLRSSGRFIWPFFYLLLLAVIMTIARAFIARPLLSAAILAVAVALQIADATPSKVRLQFESKSLDLPHASAWASAHGYRHLALYPMSIWSACFPWDEQLSLRYAYRAYLSGLTFNSGYFARINRNAARRTCAEFEHDVHAMHLDPLTIYIVTRPEDVSVFRAAGAICGRIEPEAATCVAAGSETSELGQILAAQPL